MTSINRDFQHLQLTNNKRTGSVSPTTSDGPMNDTFRSFQADKHREIDSGLDNPPKTEASDDCDNNGRTGINYHQHLLNRLDPMSINIMEETIQKFKDGKLADMDLAFNVWIWSMPQLRGIIMGMCQSISLAEFFEIDLSEILDLILEIEEGYLANPYHNFRHAVDVAFISWYACIELQGGRYLTQTDLAALILAALFHDIGHPGKNNLYQTNAKTAIGRTYQGTSILERYSCDQALEIIRHRKLMRNLEPDVVDYIEKSIVESIMATDVAVHFQLLEEFENFIKSVAKQLSDDMDLGDTSESFKGSTPTSKRSSLSPIASPNTAHFPDAKYEEAQTTLDDLNRSPATSPSQEKLNRAECSLDSLSSVAFSLTPENRMIFCKVLLHAADISNPCRPWARCKEWSDLVVEEFFMQGDAEKANNLPLSPNMDRDHSEPTTLSLGFNDHIVKPFFEALCAFCPECHGFLDNLKENRVKWCSLQVEDQRQPVRRPSVIETRISETGESIATDDETETSVEPAPAPADPKVLDAPNVTSTTISSTASSVPNNGSGVATPINDQPSQSLSPLSAIGPQLFSGRRVSVAAGVITLPNALSKVLEQSSGAVAMFNRSHHGNLNLTGSFNRIFGSPSASSELHAGHRISRHSNSFSSAASGSQQSMIDYNSTNSVSGSGRRWMKKSPSTGGLHSWDALKNDHPPNNEEETQQNQSTIISAPSKHHNSDQLTQMRRKDSIKSSNSTSASVRGSSSPSGSGSGNSSRHISNSHTSKMEETVTSEEEESGSDVDDTSHRRDSAGSQSHRASPLRNVHPDSLAMKRTSSTTPPGVGHKLSSVKGARPFVKPFHSNILKAGGESLRRASIDTPYHHPPVQTEGTKLIAKGTICSSLSAKGTVAPASYPPLDDVRNTTPLSEPINDAADGGDTGE